MFTPTLRCECAQPASDRLMRKWCIGVRVIIFRISHNNSTVGLEHIPGMLPTTVGA